MRCIFCGEASDRSKSREHIIPESLGNTEHLLPPGALCDGCNNYFAVKIEGPLLSSDHFVHLRHRLDLVNKRGLPTSVRGVYPAGRTTVMLLGGPKGLSIGPWRPRDNDQFIAAITAGGPGRIYVPFPAAPDERLLARFLAKVAVEILAHRLIGAGKPAATLLGQPELTAIRRFARYGDRPSEWPIHRRRLYAEATVFANGGYQVLHEFVLLATDAGEYYAVICLFGEEFAVNLGGPSVDGYAAYLAANDDRSPLY
jgi:hypothetical protein